MKILRLYAGKEGENESISHLGRQFWCDKTVGGIAEFCETLLRVWQNPEVLSLSTGSPFGFFGDSPQM